MTEPEMEIKRIVIACDSQCDIDAAVREAAELAGRWRVPLHGIFLLDANLLRLAELPFSREVSLCIPNVSGTLAVNELQRLLSAFAASMRRVIEGAALHEGIEWSFVELDDLPLAGSSDLAEGDILVIDLGVRPFSGAWAPRPLRDRAWAELGATVLLRRNEEGRRPRLVLVTDGSGADHERTSTALRSLARPADRLHVLMLDGPHDEAGARETASLPQGLASLSEMYVEHVRGEFSALCRRVAQLDPRLVVVDTAAMQQQELQALVEGTRCDLLLLGKKRLGPPALRDVSAPSSTAQR